MAENDANSPSDNSPSPVDPGYAAYFAHWKRVGPLLEEIELQELRAMDLPARQRAIENLLDLASMFPEERPTSGLVEWHRIMAKAFQKT